MFVDYARIYIKSGKGGDGCVAFRREAHVPKGGPSGGNGGKGGDVIIKADPNLWTLQDIKYHKSYKAKNGRMGQGSRKTGEDGDSVFIPVPLGTVIKNEETGKVLVDITSEGQSAVVAKGGSGGFGNAKFVSSTNRAPRYAKPGYPSEQKNLIFELKLLSDVGLVGLPNAGKSTLISKLTAARPKIADYPFTTLVPNLGIVKYGDFHSFVMADIPGLIEGAHQGKGLGHRFLRHIERTKILTFLIESTDPEPLQTYELLKNELQAHYDKLMLRPKIILITKNDLMQEAPLLDVEDADVISISSVTGRGLETFLQKIIKILDEEGREIQ